MDNLNNRHREPLITMVQSATTQAGASVSREVDDEHLTLLATGQADRLPPKEKERLLDLVADQPWAAQLVAELAELLGQPDAYEQNYRFPRLWVGLFSAAACLTITLVIWQIAAPSPHSIFQHIESLRLDHASEYWEMYRRRQSHSRSILGWIRDVLTILACLATLILFGCVIWNLIRKRNGPRQ